MKSILLTAVCVTLAAISAQSTAADAASVSSAPVASANSAVSTVVTDTGTFTGVPSPGAEGVNVFFGIRYAAAPEGALRWTPPQAPAMPAGPMLAAVPGPACPQPASTAPLPQSEDCLFLNVYVPTHVQTRAKLPVFVWIHGGALVTGTGAIYDLSAMVADNNIVVVTINYRLGALGWLVEPGLVAAKSNGFQNAGDGGNYGLMDQQFALQWVRRNIAGPDFGNRVLPRALRDALPQGDFIRVPVLQGSNANEGRLFEPGEIPFASTLPNIQAAGGPANFDLTNANTFCSTPQNTGKPVVCSYPQEIGLYVGALSVGLGFPTADVTPGFVAQVLQEYPLPNFPDPFLPHNAPSADEALSQIFTDVVFACNAADSNSDLSRFVPVFGYEFNDPNAPPLGSVAIRPPNDVFGFPTASEHSAELEFLFNFEAPLSADEQDLATQMQTYWANFVIIQDPNFPRRVPIWLPYNFFEPLQALVPGPQRPHPFLTFRQEHFCRTWDPVVAAEAGL